MIDITAVDRQIAAQQETALEELGRLCAQPSVAAQGLGMEACADLVLEALQARGFQARLMPTSGYPVVYGERQGTADRTLLFYNHYDVQPAEPFELWTTPPFTPTIRQGRMYARGVADNKGNIISRLAAIDALLAVEPELPCNIKFVIEGEEETGSDSFPGFVRGNQELLAADGCVWEFGGVNRQGIPVQYAGLRGICYVELRLRSASRDSHSGLGGSIFPNPAWRLTWALASLKGADERILLPGFYDRVQPPSPRDLELLAALPDEADELLSTYGLAGFIKQLEGGLALRREQIFSPTCTICGLTSGYQGVGSKTVLPAEARAKIDFRLIPDQQPEEVLDQLRRHLDAGGFEDIEIVYLGGNPAGRTDPDHPFLQLVVEAAQEAYGMRQLITPMSGGSGPNHLFVHDLGQPVATLGVGDPDSNAHAPDESIRLDLFQAGTRHAARVIAGFAML